MAYSDSFPATRPVFQADFANGGKIDPRATFSRSDSPIDATKAAASAVHFWSNEKHLSSENLFKNSTGFAGPNWTGHYGLSDTNTGQSDPSGGTNAVELVEDSTGTLKRVYQSVTYDTTKSHTVAIYAKRGVGSLSFQIKVYNTYSNWASAVFDLAGGAPTVTSGSSSSFSGVSATQTAVGSWYRCVFVFTGSSSVVQLALSDGVASPDATYGDIAYTGTSTNSVVLFGSSMSSTGGIDYNATTTSIHRQYASTLKSVSTAGQPRFEYDPATDGQSAGTSLGILIEGQSTNLRANSEQFNNWTQNGVLVDENSSIAPSGELTADTVRATGTGTHRIRQSVSIVSGSKFTGSFYAKANGYSHIQIGSANLATWAARAFFDLTNGTVGTVTSGTAEIQSVGNGWYRCIVTGDGLATASVNIDVYPADGESLSYVANEYGGTLLWGAMVEQSSHASSYIATTSSTATRAAESLSVTDASIFTSGEHSVYWEGSVNGSTADPRLFALHNNSSTDRVMVDNNDGTKLRLNVKVDSTDFVLSETITAIPDNSKVVATVKANEARLVLNGTTTVTDTSTPISSGYSTLNIGSNYGGTNHLDGHIRRISYWNTALTETQAQALTS